MMLAEKGNPQQGRLVEEEEEVGEGEASEKLLRRYPKAWPRRFRWGCGEPCGREFGWLGVVSMDGSPSRTILIHHLIRVGYSLDHKWALLSWGQLVGTLGRSSESKYEASLSVCVGCDRSWGWGHRHLLVGE